eukprot:3436744-Pleurochrysis_carterae.AAC.1
MCLDIRALCARPRGPRAVQHLWWVRRCMCVRCLPFTPSPCSHSLLYPLPNTSPAVPSRRRSPRARRPARRRCLRSRLAARRRSPVDTPPQRPIAIGRAA